MPCRRENGRDFGRHPGRNAIDILRFQADGDANALIGARASLIIVMLACIRAGLRGRFFNTVDLVNRLEAEAGAGR